MISVLASKRKSAHITTLFMAGLLSRWLMYALKATKKVRKKVKNYTLLHNCAALCNENDKITAGSLRCT